MTYTAARWGGKWGSAARAPSPCSCAMRTSDSRHTLQVQVSSASGGAGCRGSWQLRLLHGTLPAVPAVLAHDTWMGAHVMMSCPRCQAQAQPRPRFTHNLQAMLAGVAHTRTALTWQWCLRPHPQIRPQAQHRELAPPPPPRAPGRRVCCAWRGATGSCQSGWRLQHWGGGAGQGWCAFSRLRRGRTCEAGTHVRLQAAFSLLPVCCPPAAAAAAASSALVTPQTLTTACCGCRASVDSAAAAATAAAAAATAVVCARVRLGCCPLHPHRAKGPGTLAAALQAAGSKNESQRHGQL